MVLRTRMSEDAPAPLAGCRDPTACGLAVSSTALLVTPYLAGARLAGHRRDGVLPGGRRGSLVPAVREIWARPPRTVAAWALLAGNAWLLAALIADIAGAGASLGHAVGLLDRCSSRSGRGLVGQVVAAY